MALAGVLSAMREIILDVRDIPPTPAERATMYRLRFPALTADEIADLAAIPGSSWQTYTKSIFAGERNLLTRYFSVTCALLERYWGEFSDSPFSTYEITRAVHASRPWKGRTSASLAECFLEYLTVVRVDIIARHPVIADAARLEVITPCLRHAADDHYGPHDSLSSEDLRALTVGEMLSLDYYLPSVLRFRSFEYDVPALRRSFFHHKETLPEAIERRRTFAIASRNSAGFVRWTTVSESLYRFLESRPRMERAPVEELATMFVEDIGAGLSETEMFARFLPVIEELVTEGALLILRS